MKDGRFEVGDKVRVSADGASGYYDHKEVGDAGVIEEQDGDIIVRYDDGGWDFAREGLELIGAPSPPSPFRKVVTLTSPGFEFTLDSEGNFMIRDTDDDDGISLPFATLVAAVDELRKEAK